MATIFGNETAIAGTFKVPLPEVYSGDLRKWEDWSWSFKNYMFLFHSDIEDWMDYAEALKVEVTNDFLKTTRPPAGTTPFTGELQGPQLKDFHKRVLLSKRLHYLLANLTAGAAGTSSRTT